MLKIFVKNKTFKMGLHFGKSRRIIMLTKNSKQFELQKTQLQNESEFIYAKLIRGLSFTPYKC